MACWEHSVCVWFSQRCRVNPGQNDRVMACWRDSVLSGFPTVAHSTGGCPDHGGVSPTALSHCHTVTLTHCHTVTLSNSTGGCPEHGGVSPTALSHCHTDTLSHCHTRQGVARSTAVCPPTALSHCHTVTLDRELPGPRRSVPHSTVTLSH